MTTDEALAVARLRQWASDRVTIAAGRTMDYQRQGWNKRNKNTADAKLVRMIDFGQALATLDADEQAALILTYRDGESAAAVARALHCSERTVCNILPRARQALAAMLDQLNLL